MADFNLTLKQWVDWQLPLIVRQPPNSPTVPGNPVNLTGATATGSLFKGYAATEEFPFVFEFDPDPLTGEVTASLSDVAIGAIPHGLYRYEIKIEDLTGETLLFLQGQALVEAGRKPFNVV